MLVDNEAVLERIFSSTPLLIAVHCEDENYNQEQFKCQPSLVKTSQLQHII
jgi:dihydroorotase